MGKMLGIRPPSSLNRTGETLKNGQHGPERTEWVKYHLQKKEAQLFELLKRLGKGTPENRRKAADEVIKMAHLADSPRTRALLSGRLESETVSFVRAHILRVIGAMALSGIDCKEFLPQIKIILKEGSDFEKMESANALKKIGDRASVPPLAEALESGENLLPPAKRAIEDAIVSLTEAGEEGKAAPSGEG